MASLILKQMQIYVPFGLLHSRNQPLQSHFLYNKASRQKLSHLYHISHFPDNRILDSLGNHSVSPVLRLAYQYPCQKL